MSIHPSFYIMLKLLAAASFIISAAPNVFAKPPATSTPQPGQWVVDWGEQQCSLARKGGAVNMVLETPLNSSGMMGLILSGLNLPRDKNKPFLDLIISLSPGGGTYNLLATHTTNSQGAPTVEAISPLGDAFLDALARANRLTASVKGTQIAHLAFSGSDKAALELRSCYYDLLVSWGLDLDAMRSSRKRATGDMAQFISSNDYPKSALNKGESGTTTVRVRIDLQGRVSNCWLVVSSRSDALDEQTCRVLSRKAKIEPAIGANGEPVSSDEVYTVAWRLGTESPAER